MLRNITFKIFMSSNITFRIAKLESSMLQFARSRRFAVLHYLKGEVVSEVGGFTVMNSELGGIVYIADFAIGGSVALT